MTTDTKAAERLAERLARTLACPPGKRRTQDCGVKLDLCLDAHAVACWLAWAKRDDEKPATGGGRR